jgi:GDSL-like Lipase/Acylhydrolase family
MTQQNRDGAHSSQNARKIEGEIEYQFAHGHHSDEALRQEIHKLRQLDSHHGKLNKHQFQRDLRVIEHDLHEKRLLPPLQVGTDGRHEGGSDAAENARRGRPGQPLPPPEGAVSSSPDRQDASLGGQAVPTGHMDSLKAAVERAKAGGQPLTITQIGDSHVAAGMETPAIAARLAADLGLKPNQVRFSSVGHVFKTASYAKDHPGEFMKNIHKGTDLVIVSFGSNEATKQEGAQYGSDYAKLIGQIKSHDPGAAIAMVGPTDGNYWNTKTHLPGLESVTQAQENVAARTPNSSYFEVGSRMGSVSSMRSPDHALMVSDNLHLTPKGYSKLGKIIADDIARSL